MNKTGNHSIKVIMYYTVVIGSVLDIVCGITFGMFFCFSLISNQLKSGSFSAFNTTGNVTNSVSASVVSFIWLVLCAICVVIYPFLVKKRQELRDEVEYDEFGVNRKRGSFSQLSKKERDAIEQQKMIDAERILDAPTLKKITHTGSDNPEADLEKLIGLSNVKNDIKQMEARMLYEQTVKADQKRKKKKDTERNTETLSSMHMIFSGAPGTGKTTVARIMAGLLYKYGYIKKNQSVEIDGNFFNGLSIGESSKKVSMLIQKSLGGVIFIDEAYALLSNGGGQEVIATIVKAMEDYRDEVVFIFAGYEKEMQDFVNSNPGIQSRVKYHMYFGNYTITDMKRIFKTMANEKSLLVSQELLDKFANEIQKISMSPNFGNARTIRNILDKIIDQHAVNMMNGTLKKDATYRLMLCDFPQNLVLR